MNKYFVNITADLDLKKDSETLSNTSTSFSSILERYHCRQSIFKIKDAFNTPDNFPFMKWRRSSTRILISDATKFTPVRDISAGMLKSTIDIHGSIKTKITDLSSTNDCFPDDLKAAEVSPIF